MYVNLLIQTLFCFFCTIILSVQLEMSPIRTLNSTSEIVFHPWYPDTGTSLHDEDVIAVFRSRICILYSTSEMSPWKLSVDMVSKSFQEVVNIAQKLENTVQPVVGWSFPSSAIEDVDHDALWLALLRDVRGPGTHAPNCSMTEEAGRTQHAHVREERWEVVHRDVTD